MGGDTVINKEILKRLIPINSEEQRFLDGANTIDKSIYMEQNNAIVNSKKLLESGKMIAVRPHTRFARFPEHTHDFVEVIYMCSGSTTHIVDGNKIVLNEGELLFLGQNTIQEVLPAGENDIAINFIIMPDFFTNSLKLLGDENTPLRNFIVECLRGNKSKARYLHFKVSDVLPIQNLVENLILTLIQDVQNKRRINESTMELLFLHLLNYTERLVYKSQENELVFEVFRYVEQNYKDGNLTELAKALHYDFTWLSKEIKRQTGKNYTDLIQEKRLSQACFLLRHTNFNVSEIAERIGYENISYFHRLFQKQYGVSPNKYRKLANKDTF